MLQLLIDPYIQNNFYYEQSFSTIHVVKYKKVFCLFVCLCLIRNHNWLTIIISIIIISSNDRIRQIIFFLFYDDNGGHDDVKGISKTYDFFSSIWRISKKKAWKMKIIIDQNNRQIMHYQIWNIKIIIITKAKKKYVEQLIFFYWNMVNFEGGEPPHHRSSSSGTIVIIVLCAKIKTTNKN